MAGSCETQREIPSGQEPSLVANRSTGLPAYVDGRIIYYERFQDFD